MTEPCRPARHVRLGHRASIRYFAAGIAARECVFPRMRLPLVTFLYQIGLPRRDSCRVTSYFARRNRRALKITEAELRLIASAAIMGDSSQPVIG